MPTKNNIGKIYYVLCLLLVVLIGTIRGKPFYGKFDFITVDTKPWWPSWKPMIEEVLQGDQQKPILSDPITSTVFKGVFGQETIYSRERAFSRNSLIVEKLEKTNHPYFKATSPGSLLILLSDDSNNRNDISEIIYNYVYDLKEKEKSYPIGLHPHSEFRCVINSSGFQPTWVAFETGHWNPKLADTKWFYRYRGSHVKDLPKEFVKYPPKYCKVF